MKKFSGAFAALGAVTLTALAGYAFANQGGGIPKALSRLPNFPAVEKVTKLPYGAIYEVQTAGRQVFYTDEKGEILIVGNMIEVKTQKNLTRDRIEALSKIAWSELKFENSFSYKKGNGKREIAVFTDPNCPYCKKFEEELSKLDNVTIHYFPVKFLGPDSAEKAASVWCANDKVAAWHNWMLKGAVPEKKECDASAIDRNMEFARVYGVTGTPTSYFRDGSRLSGLVPREELEKRFASIGD